MSVPIPRLVARIRALQEERAAVEDFPVDELSSIIQEVGFSCDCCGRCCTRQFNGHVYLTPDEATKIRATDISALEPAPVYDFCDQNGILFASGYTIRTLGDSFGTCWFLKSGRCQIYSRRPEICRIYPYMLHREPDIHGVSDWRQISGLDQHGIYHTTITRNEAREIACEVKRFEDQVLSEEIEFLEMISRYFGENNLRQVRKCHDEQMQRFRNGETVTVMVYHRGGFEAWKVSKKIAEPLNPISPAE